MPDALSAPAAQQYWAAERPWHFVTPANMAAAFAAHPLGKAAAEELRVAPERTEKGEPCSSCSIHFVYASETGQAPARTSAANTRM